MIKLSEHQSKALQGICKASDSDYVTILSDGVHINFIGYSAEVFQVVRFKGSYPECNLRLMKDNLALVSKTGFLSLRTESKSLILGWAENEQACNEGRFEISVVCLQQMNIDRVADNIIKTVEATYYKDIKIIHDTSLLEGFTKLTRLGANGVVFVEDMIFTSGGGFKAFTATPSNSWKFALTPTGLKEMSQFAKGVKLQYTVVDNYIVCKKGDFYLGVKKMNSMNYRELDSLKDMSPDFTATFNLQNVIKTFNAFSVKKGEHFVFELIPKENKAVLREKHRGIIVLRADCSEDLPAFKLDYKLFKDCLSALGIGSGIFSFSFYGSIVSIVSGINHLLLKKVEG